MARAAMLLLTLSLFTAAAITDSITDARSAPAPFYTRNAVTRALHKSGTYTRFLALLQKTGADEFFLQQAVLHKEASGVTIFAPDDTAFARLSTKQAQQLARLSSQRLKALAEAHAALNFYPDLLTWAWETVGMPIPTLCPSFSLILGMTESDDVTLDAGSSTAVVDGAVYLEEPVAIFRLDHVLLPNRGIFT